MKAGLFVYVTSEWVTRITRSKRSGRQPRFGETLHDTWGDAHAALIARTANDVTAAEKDLARAKRSHAKAQAMKEPAP